VTVFGRGIIFPAGYVSAVFSGNARTDFELDEPTQRLVIRVPAGAVSGAFGFTIAGRTRFTENSHPTEDGYVSYRVEFPGFTVLGDPVAPGSTILQAPEISPPASS